MGNYTTNFKLYKPSANEVVDVDLQLGANLDIVDYHARGMLDYSVYNTASAGIDGALKASVTAGFKWYKPYSNALFASQGAIFNVSQDLYSHVDTWVDAASLVDTSSGAWAPMPGFEIAYRIISSTGSTTEIEWCGRLWLGGTAITKLTNYTPVINNMPAGITPITSKYFNVNAGNTTTDYAEARVMIHSGGHVEIMKYGSGTATASTENYIDLGGVKYNLEAVL